MYVYRDCDTLFIDGISALCLQKELGTFKFSEQLGNINAHLSIVIHLKTQCYTL